MTAPRTVPELCRIQADWCEKLGSPLYAHLLRRSAEDYDQRGPARELLAPHAHDPRGSALALRMMGAVHRLALRGEAPDLARFYPSCGGRVELEPAWTAFRRTLAGRSDTLGKLVLNPVQTNEVGRCGPLLGGFLLVAHRTGLPLRLLEIGASAGLNLNWDQYRYTWPGGAWGNPQSAIVLREVFAGERVPPLCNVTVAERRGCDPSPLDPDSSEDCLTLRSFVWADQQERMRILDQAIQVARLSPRVVDRARAVDWLRPRLADLSPGQSTVLFHSVVWQYLVHQERQELMDLIRERGSRTTTDSPFAWLRMEPGKEGAEVKLTIFPGVADRVIATAEYHKPNTLWRLENE